MSQSWFVILLPQLFNAAINLAATFLNGWFWQSLGLLINLMEYSPFNRRQFMQEKTTYGSANSDFTQLDTRATKRGKRDNDKLCLKAELSAVEAFVKLFLENEKLARRIEDEEKLHETSSVEDDGNESANEGFETWAKFSDDAGQMSPRRSKRRQATTIDNLISSACESQSQGDRASKVPIVGKLDDEFIDDGEGGIIWVGKGAE